VAARDPKEPMAVLLGRVLSGDASAGESCLEPEFLAAYFERVVDTGEAARCELHLSSCTRCREQLAALSRADESLVPREEKGEQVTAWSRFWNWRILAPALAVVAVAAGVWVYERTLATGMAEQNLTSPLVAMNPPAAPALPPDAVVATRGASPAAKSEVKQAPPADVEKMRAPAEQKKQFASRVQISSNPVPNSRGRTEADALSNSSEESKSVAAGAPAKAGAGVAAIPAIVPSAPPPQPLHEVAGFEANDKTSTAATAGAASEALAAVQAQLGVDAAKAKPSGSADDARQVVQRAQTRETLPGQAVPMNGLAPRAREIVIRTPNPKVLWRIMGVGFIERSEDGGAVWQGQSSSSTARLTAGSAPSAKICWVVGERGAILLTRDAKNWTTIPPPVVAEFVAVEARDASAATVTSSDGRKFTTTNAGQAWTPVN
jgi:hypothetical protein